MSESSLSSMITRADRKQVSVINMYYNLFFFCHHDIIIIRHPVGGAALDVLRDPNIYCLLCRSKSMIHSPRVLNTVFKPNKPESMHVLER